MTYSSNISMNNALHVNVVQTPRDLHELDTY